MYQPLTSSVFRISSDRASISAYKIIQNAFQKRRLNTPVIDETSSNPKLQPKSKVNELVQPLCNCDDPSTLSHCSKSSKCQYRVKDVPVFIKTWGCQMNENDTSIVSSILHDFGYKIVSDESEAEIQLLMTCAIRESAERKIWAKLQHLGQLKDNKTHPLKQVGLLGCMAERLKEKVLDSSSGIVDIVAGPDAYRDLPRLFSVNRLTQEKAINCLLSFDETYSDIRPVTNVNDVTSYISITRGCDNLCSYCIVPFTRGRERSRPITTILEEVKLLLEKGVKEVTLLGQNVNSYRDLTTPLEVLGRHELSDKINSRESIAPGFKTVYKPRVKGLTFDVLLEEVAKISPELRIRFTSPHPKDFTDDVIDVIGKYPNICRNIHLPAQSGSNTILSKMRRGYTREAYLDLVDHIRKAVPDIALTSDFIVGFCGESEEDHELSLDLIRKVKYNFVFMFPYSMREKTHAFHKYQDDIPQEIKVKRVQDVYFLFREHATELNSQLIGTRQLVLVEKDSSKSSEQYVGRIDMNIKTILPKLEVMNRIYGERMPIKVGDYVVCEVVDSNSQTLKGIPLYVTSQYDYHSIIHQDENLSNHDRTNKLAN